METAQVHPILIARAEELILRKAKEEAHAKMLDLARNDPHGADTLAAERAYYEASDLYIAAVEKTALLEAEDNCENAA